MAQRDVDVLPLQALYVCRAQTCSHREYRHVGQVLGQLSKQPLELGNGQGANAALCLAEELELRHTLDPLPFVAGAFQDRSDQSQIAVGRSGAGDLFACELDLIDQCPVDLVKRLARQ